MQKELNLAVIARRQRRRSNLPAPGKSIPIWEIAALASLTRNDVLSLDDFARLSKPGTQGKTFGFPYQAEWESTFYEEKEVTVYFKQDDAQGSFC